jgi:hypothetical protein
MVAIVASIVKTRSHPVATLEYWNFHRQLGEPHRVTIHFYCPHSDHHGYNNVSAVITSEESRNHA